MQIVAVVHCTVAQPKSGEGRIEEGEGRREKIVEGGEEAKGWNERVREVIIPRSSHFQFLILEVVKNLETEKAWERV